MPFKSRAQQKFLFANKPEMASKWAAETPPGPLPQRVGSETKATNAWGKMLGSERTSHGSFGGLKPRKIG